MTDDPYRILIAEVMLHRTQALQVVPVYEKFLRLYPDLKKLSQAIREDLQQVLHSLGLRWRIDLIYEMASQIMGRFGGKIPEGKSDLMSLPGVSEYIASAVRCFSWDLPERLMDTNTVRVTGRVFGLEIKDSSRRSRRFKDLLLQLIDTKRSRAFNYALLDLADQICSARKPPSCELCPIRLWCEYAAQRRPELFKKND
jgi:A/G-specific adenine glycosylase